MRTRLNFDTRRMLGRADILGFGLQGELLARFPLPYLMSNRVLPVRFDEAEARLDLVMNEPDRVELIDEILGIAGARSGLVKRAGTDLIEELLDEFYPDKPRVGDAAAGGDGLVEAISEGQEASDPEVPPVESMETSQPIPPEPDESSTPEPGLDAVAVTLSPGPDLEESETWSGVSGRQRVLIVESDPRLRNAVGTLFEQEGHRVTVADGLRSVGGLLKAQIFDLAVVRSRDVEDAPALLSMLRERNASAELNVTAGYSQLLRGEPVSYDSGARFWFGFVEMALGMLGEALPDAPRADRRLLSRATLVAQSLGLPRKTVDSIRLAMILEHLGAVQVHLSSRGTDSARLPEAAARVVPTLMRELRCPYEVLSLIEAARRGESDVASGTDSTAIPIEAQVLVVAKRFASHRASGGSLADFESKLRAGVGPAYDARVAETLLSVLKGDRLLARLDQGQRVVIADSSVEDTATLALRLRNEGFDVEVCRDGQAALETIRREPPQLVVSEVALPKVDGFGVLSSMRTDPRLARTPFLFVSSRSEASVVARGLRLGADDHLSKPVDPDVVVIKATRLLAAANPANEASISGNLGEVSLIDLLQLVSEAAKTVRIEVQGTTTSGDIFLRDGALVHARCGARSGAEAFLSLVPLSEGRFTVHAAQDAPEDSIEQPLELLILEGIRVSS